MQIRFMQVALQSDMAPHFITLWFAKDPKDQVEIYIRCTSESNETPENFFHRKSKSRQLVKRARLFASCYLLSQTSSAININKVWRTLMVRIHNLITHVDMSFYLSLTSEFSQKKFILCNQLISFVWVLGVSNIINHCWANLS